MKKDHKRGTGLGDGKRFDAIKAQHRPTIRMNLPDEVATTDSLSSMVYQSYIDAGEVEQQVLHHLNADNLYGQDRFRHLIMKAVGRGEIAKVQMLSLLSSLNTTRLNMLYNRDQRLALTQANPELAKKFFEIDSTLLPIFYSSIQETPQMSQLLRTLINTGQGTIVGKFVVEGYTILVLDVADI